MNDHVDSKPADEAGAPTPAEGTASQPENLGEGGGNVHQEGTSTVPSGSGPSAEDGSSGASGEDVVIRLDNGKPTPLTYLGRTFDKLTNRYLTPHLHKPKEGLKRASRKPRPLEVRPIKGESIPVISDVGPEGEDIKPNSPVVLELIGSSIFLDLDDKRREFGRGIAKFVDENWVPIKTGISAVATIYLYIVVVSLTGYFFQIGVNAANKEPK